MSELIESTARLRLLRKKWIRVAMELEAYVTESSNEGLRAKLTGAREMIERMTRCISRGERLRREHEKHNQQGVTKK